MREGAAPADRPSPSGRLRAAEVGTAAQLACLLEASAPKPGNVSPGRHFRDIRYEHFLASAAAVGPALAGAGERRLGATVRLAIEASARWTPSNTNLGIVLLLAPIARAAAGAMGARDSPEPAAWPAPGLRTAVRRVLAETTVDDARDVYRAIRLAAPGGLGRADSQDVAAEPTATLLETMRLAVERDGVAREYTTGFETTFAVGAPALERARGDGLAWEDAVVETFLVLLEAAPDTHVARRAGPAAAAEVSRRAREALAAGGVRTRRGRDAVAAMDAALRDARNQANPGTTADLTAAAIFVVLLGGGWNLNPGGADERTR